MTGPAHATLSAPRTLGPRAVAAPMRWMKCLGRARAPDVVGPKRLGPYHFLARIGTFQRVAAPFPGGASGRHARRRPRRPRSRDRRRASPPELRPARGAPRPIDRLRPADRLRAEALCGMASTEPDNGLLLRGCGGKNKYRTFCPSWQEICRSEIVAVPLRGLALPSPAEPVEASGEGRG